MCQNKQISAITVKRANPPRERSALLSTFLIINTALASVRYCGAPALGAAGKTKSELAMPIEKLNLKAPARRTR